ncbi:SARP family transcriptional regulator [Streptomyces sp. PT12]|nr:SARP family transcriptional regulator [Streptomyces sp. PT12]
MQFRILGTMEITDQSRSIQLRGMTQRAVLGYLLLHANETVATSQLLRALWGDKPPITARKMLQNAVAGLRRRLDARDARQVSLLTHAPGYLLRVDPERVDWFRFRGGAEQGRAELAVGAWGAAATLLREALGLWRGPLLADLAEVGVDWPELATAEGMRLAVLEDCAEAELAIGRHHEVIDELAAAAEAAPRRERLCGLLMMALYRCGRQADALESYRRTRTVLVDELGLDPGHELRELERSILNHDPSLALLAAGGTAVSLRSAPADLTGPAEAAADGADARQGAAAQGADEPPPQGDARAAGSERGACGATVERKWVSVLLVRAQEGEGGEAQDPEDAAEGMRWVTAAVREEVDRYGGVLHGRMGSVWLALFGVERNREDDAQRAVRAALAIRDRVAARQPADALPEPAPRAAVATGEVLVTPSREPGHDAGTPEVAGGVLDVGMRLLMLAAPREVRVCDATRQMSEAAFVHGASAQPMGGWRVTAIRECRVADQPTPPFVERERELEILRALLRDVLRRRRPQLAAVVGEAGVGKSRLVAELALTVGDVADGFRFVLGRTASFPTNTPFGPLADVVRSLLGVRHTDSPTVVEERLLHTVRRLVGPGEAAARLLPHLRPLAGLTPGPRPRGGTPEAFAAWRRFLEEAATERPLVMVFEDLDRAETPMIEFVQELIANARPVPVLIVATARPVQSQPRPCRHAGFRDSTTLLLDPLSDAGAAFLLSSLLPPLGPGEQPLDARHPLVASIGGNPLFAVEYARALRDGPADREIPTPPAVRSIIAARLDTLPRGAKAVLQDAAIFGASVDAVALAAVGGRSWIEVRRHLESLERGEFLRRNGRVSVTGDPEYDFQQVVVREVAYAQMPREVRSAKHSRAARWLEMREAERAVPRAHRPRAAPLAAPAG